MTDNTKRAKFHEWAEKAGNDMACAYDANRGAFVYLNPLTADLWSAWQAARTVPDVRCKCCGYLVTEREHRGCLRAAEVTVPDWRGWRSEQNRTA